jgi:hypothetical protein
MTAMEQFLPVLSTVQVRLREILTRNEEYMLSWDLAKIRSLGEDLIELAGDVYPQLVQVEHRVLCASLREAGLGIIHRAATAQKRQTAEEDKEYFRNVHEILGTICRKIETGEYYQALLKVSTNRAKENYVL